MIKYFFRLDDIAPNMNWDNFEIILKIFKDYNIKPLLAIIPDVKDKKLVKYPIKNDFWQIMRELDETGWVIAQHGYQHLSYGSGGILKIHNNGEFGGIDLIKQENMVKIGREILKKQLLVPNIFVAPRHSFDKNTTKALKKNDFDFISDGVALWPFKKWNIIWLPQILWRPRKGMFGLITIALHVNTMNGDDFENFEIFIKKNREKVGDFSELTEWHKKSGFIKKFLTFFINQIFKIFWYSIFYFRFKILNN